MGAAKKLEIESQSRIDYDVLEKEKTYQIQLAFQKRLKNEFEGQGTSLRRMVLQNVVDGQYELAKQVISTFIQTKESYPDFGPRATPIAKHSEDLITAIEAKRSLPNMHVLNMSRQKEVLDHVIDHFNELKHCLKNIEKIAGDELLADFRSTQWLLRTVSYTVLGLVVISFIMHFSSDIGQPFWVVADNITENIATLMTDWFGL